MSNKSLAVKTSYSLVDIRMDADTFPRLVRLTTTQARAGLSKIIADAFLYKGQTADKENVKFITSALLEELLADTTYGLPFLTMEEIRRAIKKAVLTDPDFIGINVSSLYKVLLAYAKGDGHTADLEAREIARNTSPTGYSSELTAILNKYAKKITRKP